MSGYYQQRWREIHTKALELNKEEYCKFIRTLSLTLSCGSCRAHFQNYIVRSPPEQSQDNFIWSVEFHNSVNQRLRKPVMALEIARTLYTPPV